MGTSIYHSYSNQGEYGQALLTAEKYQGKYSISIIKDFDELFVATGKF